MDADAERKKKGTVLQETEAVRKTGCKRKGFLKMLVSEFARKYGVSQALVYETSFQTETRMATPSVTDIPEAELIKVVEAALQKRITYHVQRVNEAEKVLKAFRAASGAPAVDDAVYWQ